MACKCGPGETCGGKCAPTSAPDIAAKHAPFRGRFERPAMPDPENGFGRGFNRNYEVNPYTGFTYSTLPAGRWSRGAVLYAPTPSLVLAAHAPVFDRTDPRTWPGAYG